MTHLKSPSILIDNTSRTDAFVSNLLAGSSEIFRGLNGKTGLLFSKSEIKRFMDKEERHDVKILTKGTSQTLKSMSSGEQKKALLGYILQHDPDFLILVNPYDNLDVDTQAVLKEQLLAISKTKTLIQMVSRLEDFLPIQSVYYKLMGDTLKKYTSHDSFLKANQYIESQFTGTIPPPLHSIEVAGEVLVRFKNVSVGFEGHKVLDSIDWSIKKGEFWQLIGPNGSGKTTLLSMITGDSHKGYGQDLTIFGQKKGSGESVWDLKKKIGYYTPSMTDKFKGHHNLEDMVISGLYDSVGLYNYATDQEKSLALSWLKLLQLDDKRNMKFLSLTTGEKRLVMTARAMIKHPPLLILDEPTAGLDEKSTGLFIALVNKIAKESDTTVIFVSHRKESGLLPKFDYILKTNLNGSTGKVKQHAYN
ncbi:Spermidine/putrescine import ATP-binding protein PotA [Flagellimonas maritima]|uniref:Spermidine/putrescine import ATP-binding protein PotA n=1 Tax=Flagellimonas maritima TaxID=1383885 RepID=A0A2Z4LQP1_9FLAO|nr:ATP-binding cassette domain-containing protein [Allomuricauda aurantiaca]AWX43567.1 Spermidine/putrescine import ATP-binding protein PotA [Allomuricauda aurantiaca]